MEDPKPTCDHTCQYDCTLISEALRREAAMGLFYEELSYDCDYPDVRALVEKIASERRASVDRLMAEVNRIYTGLDPAGV